MIPRNLRLTALVGLAALGAGSCLPDYSFVPCGDGTNPAVCIISPAVTPPASSVVISEFVGPMHPVTVEMVAANFTLRPAGQCMGAPRCGHIHLRVTDHTVAMGDIECSAAGPFGYNVAGASLTLTVLLDLCNDHGGNALGQHNIIAELHDDAHNLVPNSLTDSVHITALF